MLDPLRGSSHQKMHPNEPIQWSIDPDNVQLLLISSLLLPPQKEKGFTTVHLCSWYGLRITWYEDILLTDVSIEVSVETRRCTPPSRWSIDPDNVSTLHPEPLN